MDSLKIQDALRRETILKIAKLLEAASEADKNDKKSDEKKAKLQQEAQSVLRLLKKDLLPPRFRYRQSRLPSRITASLSTSRRCATYRL